MRHYFDAAHHEEMADRGFQIEMPLYGPAPDWLEDPDMEPETSPGLVLPTARLHFLDGTVAIGGSGPISFDDVVRLAEAICQYSEQYRSRIYYVLQRTTS